MPIRFVDRRAHVGQVAAALDGAQALLEGTHIAPPARAGVIGTQLAPLVLAAQAGFTPSANRTGSISATLGGATALLSGTHTASSGSLTAPGVSGTIADRQQISIFSDGVNLFGSTGPTYAYFDDCSNYGTVGALVGTNTPQVGSFQASPLEQIVDSGGRNGRKARLVTYVTPAERVTRAGKREGWIVFANGMTLSEVFIWRDLRFEQAGSYSGSFWKVEWPFFGPSGFTGSTVDVVMPTFNGGTNGVAFTGNSGGGTWELTMNGGFGMSKMDMAGGWNTFLAHLKINPVKGQVDQRRFRNHCANQNFDSGASTSNPVSLTATSNQRTVDRATSPGWMGDTNDSRIQGNNKLLYGTGYYANNPARVVFRNAANSQLYPLQVTGWTNNQIDGFVCTGNLNLSNMLIEVYNANDSIVQYNGSNTRLIS